MIGEDYSPCSLRQPYYSAADPATGDGFEVTYKYDTYEPDQTAADATFSDSAAFAAGMLTAVRDRAGHVQMNHDGRGRLRQLGRRLAAPPPEATDPTPPPPVPPPPPTYTSQWYRSRLDYDLGNRLVRRTSGVTESASALLVNGNSEEQWLLDLLGRPLSISTSYGLLLRSATYRANGAVESLAYGDGANTQSDFTYDEHDRVIRAHTWRSAPALWSGPFPTTYSPPDADTTSLELHDIEIPSYDEVGNPLIVTDFAGTNPIASQPPLQRFYAYDDEYRITSANLAYYGAGADWTNPFRAETSTGDRSPVPPNVAQQRVQSQGFAYDGLGNIESSVDDVGMNWDRSLGAVTHGTATDGPNQLRAADGITASYDEAGNLVELLVERQGACQTGGELRCKQWFSYDWDETGRLMRARRWDYGAAFPTVPPAASASERGVPSDTPTRDIRFAYSTGERVVSWKKDEVETLRTTATVLPTLRIDHARFVDGEYEAREAEQRPRLAGMAEARVDPTLPSPSGWPVHLFMALTDELGSSTVILEHETGEVAERVTYQAYGATEQDARPERWGSHREPMRFTGKEDDVEIGLTYFGARYYAPNLNQWASADPLTIHAMGADLNPYAYVAGRVTTHVDPFGLAGQSADGYDDTVIVHGTRPAPPPRDVQYNDRDGQAMERLTRWAKNAGNTVAQWNNEWMRSANWVSLGFLESLPLAPPGLPGPTLEPAVNALGVGQSPRARALRPGGHVLSLLAMLSFGAEAAGVEGLTALGAARRGFGARLASQEAGGGAREATGPIRVTEKGLGIVKQHLEQFGRHGPNDAMIGRLRDAMKAGTRVAGPDANFYLHELNEATLMGRGMTYEVAHAAALGKYGVSPFSLYAPSVVQAYPALFNSAWFTYWGLR